MQYIIGVDEVGRGPLAGPVVLAAVCIPAAIRFGKNLGRLRDSKQLSALKRSRWANYFRKHSKIIYALSRIYPRGIEKMNISRAANLAAYRACLRLIRGAKIDPLKCKIYLDGGLYPRSNKVSLPSKTLVRGDEKITAIKIASILAKVQRDKFMEEMAKRYPQYEFEKHKGYGTKRHRKLLKKYGPSEIHRLTFLHKYSTIKA